MTIDKYKCMIQEMRNHEVIINNALKISESRAVSYEQALELMVVQLSEKSKLYEKQLTEMYHKHGL